MPGIKKVVILGPESTGKSTLSQQLADHYQSLWCPEYAREYLLENGTAYTYDDLLLIAKGQVNLEEAYIEKATNLWQQKQHTSSPVLIVDTDMYVMKVWCEYVFGNCHQFILESLATQTADLYLLTNVDLPWTKDELREYPDLESRLSLFHIYKDLLVNQSKPWTVISGVNGERLSAATKAIDQLLSI